jgi:hypothetical protein
MQTNPRVKISFLNPRKGPLPNEAAANGGKSLNSVASHCWAGVFLDELRKINAPASDSFIDERLMVGVTK